MGLGPEEERPSRSPRGVLIAESDSALAELYRATLEADGWRVDVVDDFGSVMERIHRARPAVLLVNAMRDADQLTVVARVRSTPGMEELLIIVLYDSLDHLDTSRLSRMNVQAWLSKTRTTREKLSQTIADLARNAPQGKV